MEGVDGRHVVFPAGTEGNEDEEAEVAEGVTVLVFFLAEKGGGTNPFDRNLRHLFMALMWGVVMVKKLVMGGRLGML